MNKSYCVAPWKGIFIDSNGNVKPDGIYKQVLGNLNTSTLIDIWNGEKWRNLRNDSLNFDLNQGCLHCANKEKLSGHSRRMFFETFFGEKLPKHDLELSTNFTKYNAYRPAIKDTVNPDFIFLDIITSNKCNLKCIHCCSAISTSWKQDDKKLVKNNFFKNIRSVKDYNLISDQIIENLFDNSFCLENLRYVSLRGGEPLYELQNIKILKKLVDLGWNKNIVLDISTNGTVDDKQIFDLLQKFKGVIFYVSIEGCEELYQYCRGGKLYDFSTVEKTVYQLKNISSTQEICLTYTTMAPNIFNIKKTWSLINKYLNFCTYSFTNTVSEPSYLSLNVLNMEMKKRAIDLLEGMPEVIKTGFRAPYSLGIENLKKSLEKNVHENQKELWIMFKEYINCLDKIRDTDFLSVEPIYKEFWNV